MSTIIKFDLKELRKLSSLKDSCVSEKKVTLNLALQPWCLGNLKESIKSVLDYKIGKFDKEFNGILLSYKNLRILQNIGNIRNDKADIHFQVQADYFIFQPSIGATLSGIVNKKSITHLGVLVHRVFNVVIPRPTEEPGNRWIGTQVKEGQRVNFRIVVLDLFGALPYIRGELDERSLDTTYSAEEDSGARCPFTVSYVNFDKAKPNLKQIGDGLPQSPIRAPTLSPTSSPKIKQNKTGESKRDSGSNFRSNPSRNYNPCDSTETFTEKVKIKRHKNSDAEVAAAKNLKRNKKESS